MHFTENLKSHPKVNQAVDLEDLVDIAMIQFQRKGLSLLLNQDLLLLPRWEGVKALLKGLMLSHFHFLACTHQI